MNECFVVVLVITLPNRDKPFLNSHTLIVLIFIILIFIIFAIFHDYRDFTSWPGNIDTDNGGVWIMKQKVRRGFSIE